MNEETNRETIEEFCYDRSYNPEDNLFVRLLREQGLNNSQIVTVISVLNGTCRECFDAPRGCRCWDDS